MFHSVSKWEAVLANLNLSSPLFPRNRNLWFSAGLLAIQNKDYISQCPFRQVWPHDLVLVNGV